MNFDQMKQIIEIYHCGSINRAAQNLFMTQSSLSKSIGALEKELGKKILVRTYTGTSLTPFGEEILRYAQDMLRSAEAIRLLARENTLKRQLSLRVSAACLRFSSYAFLQVACRHIHESIRVHHIQDSISGVVFDVMNEESEVGLIYASNHLYAKSSRFLTTAGWCTPLCSGFLRFCCFPKTIRFACFTGILRLKHCEALCCAYLPKK